MAARRCLGVEVRGSIIRARSESSVVMERQTDTALCRANSCNKSMSRVTRISGILPDANVCGSPGRFIDPNRRRRKHNHIPLFPQ